jgi:hypothetical protein
MGKMIWAVDESAIKVHNSKRPINIFRYNYLSLSPNADIPLNSISSPPINTARANPPAIKSIKKVVSIVLKALSD